MVELNYRLLKLHRLHCYWC